MGIRDDIQSALEKLNGDAGDAGVDGATGATEVEAAPAVVEIGDDGAEAPIRTIETETGVERAARARDGQGRFAKGTGEKPEAKPEPKSVAPKTDAPAVVDPAKPAEPAQVAKPEAHRAPQSWKPSVREKFSALPPEVQAEVVRIENETKATLRDVAEARRMHQQFQQTVGPFEAMIRSEGGEPMAAVGNLLRTAYALRTAPPAHKAQIVAQMVQNFSVPIDALDAALSGQSPQVQQPHQQQGAYRDPRVDQILAMAQQAQQSRQQQMSQSAAQELAAVQQLEFYEDVREDMADIIESRARRGVEVKPQQAYDLAVRMHPDISGIIQQRESAKAAANAQASTQRAKAAAASVKTRPAGIGNTSDGPRTMRDDILAARDSLMGSR